MAKIVDADERRAHIIAATWRVVAARGLDEATMRIIASEAGCTTGMVTHYFANKDEILEALVREVSHRAQRRLTQASGGAEGVEGLRSLLLQSLPLDPVRIAEWRVWLALWNRSVTDRKLAAEWARRERAWMVLLRDAVEKAVAHGGLPHAARRDSDVETVSALAFGLSVGAILSPRRLGPRAMVGVIDDYLNERYGKGAPSRGNGLRKSVSGNQGPVASPDDLDPQPGV